MVLSRASRCLAFLCMGVDGARLARRHQRSSLGEASSDVGTFANPILTNADNELADPAFLDDRARTHRFYMYPTGDQYSYDVYSSEDMVNWEKGPQVLSSRDFCPYAFAYGPADSPMLWAPEVIYDPDSKRYYMYYTKCISIGVAVSDDPMGPFTDLGKIVDWAIDGHVFRDDDGRMYFYYGKIHPLQFWHSIEHIWVQPMVNATHLDRSQGPTEVLKPSQDWEFLNGGGPFRGVNEGPWMVKVETTYYLMYSGADAHSVHYALGYATATSPTGPFTKFESNPITVLGAQVYGPGHHAVWRDDAGQHWCIYHVKEGDSPGWDRVISMDPLHIGTDGSLSVNTTLRVQQPVPRINAL